METTVGTCKQPQKNLATWRIIGRDFLDHAVSLSVVPEVESIPGACKAEYQCKSNDKYADDSHHQHSVALL